MGNLSFIHPTENKDEFDKPTILNLLSQNFGNDIDIDDQDDEVHISNKQGDDGFRMIFDGKNSLIENIDDDLGALDVLSESFKNLSRFKNKDFDERCIAVSYPGDAPFLNIRRRIVKYLQEYFTGYVLDEGTYPEMIKAPVHSRC